MIALSSCSIKDAKDAVTPDDSTLDSLSLTPNVADGAKDVKVSTYVKVLAEDGTVSNASDRKSTRLNSSHSQQSRMPSSA